MATSRSRTVRQRFVDANGVDKLWMFVITILVLLSLRGCGPLGIQGNDDIARDGRETAKDAQEAADQAKKAVARNRELIRDQRITRRQIARIAREQAKPSTAQILRLIRKATQVCAAQPQRCRRIGGGSSTSSSTTTSQQRRQQARTPPRPTARSPARRRPSRRPATTPTSSPTPSQPPAPGHQDNPAVVDVHTPDTGLPKHPVCVDDIVHIDC